jgi:hypothetical protein
VQSRHIRSASLARSIDAGSSAPERKLLFENEGVLSPPRILKPVLVVKTEDWIRELA